MKLQKYLICISFIIAILLLIVIFSITLSATAQNILIGFFSSVLVAGLFALVQYLSIKASVVENVQKTTAEICSYLIAIKLANESIGSSIFIIELTNRTVKLCKEFDPDYYSPIIPKWSKVRRSMYNIETIYRNDICASLEISVVRLVKNTSIPLKDNSFNEDKLELNNQIDMIINNINRYMMIICSNRWSKQFTKITECNDSEVFKSIWDNTINKYL